MQRLLVLCLAVIVIFFTPIYASEVKFIQATDIQLTSDNSQYLKDFVNDINTKYSDIDFIVFTGDNIDKPAEKDLYLFLEIIKQLKEAKKSLKKQIEEMEEKLNNTILENEEPTDEIIQDITRLKEIIIKQKQGRKDVNEMIKRYKKNKKEMKKDLNVKKEIRDYKVDDLEL